MLEASAFSSLAGREPGSEDRQSHYRKGLVGDWKAAMSDAQARRMVEALDPLTAQVEERFGLDLSDYRRM
jgi:hypothetical protein